jgi:crotonobetainyl-CoA:carnitine CoA-transferase CaiB-like acyl-CoA transferase
MNDQNAPQRAGPLAGRRVLELCSTVAGPACARLLGDYGAEVIKIEPLIGDPVRQMGHLEGDISLYAASILRNKRSVALDLKSAEGRAVARALAAKCDVVVENFRPGKLEQMGLGYDTLRHDNPRVVLVRISGYGQSGPNSQKPGYGTICEAYGGVRHLTGEPDSPPPRIAVALTDYLAALYAAFGTMLALLECERSGRGQVVDVSLFEAAFSLLEPDVPAFDRLGIVANRQGSQCPGLAPNNLYLTRDDAYVLIAANNDVIFERLCGAMGAPGLLRDPRFASIRARSAHAREIDLEVGRWIGSLTAPQAMRALEAADVPSSLVATIADAFADPHFHARQAITHMAHPTLGPVAMAGLVAKLSRTPGGLHSVGPEVGADTRAVLQELVGLTPAMIRRLEEQGAAGVPPELENIA